MITIDIMNSSVAWIEFICQDYYFGVCVGGGGTVMTQVQHAVIKLSFCNWF